MSSNKKSEIARTKDNSGCERRRQDQARTAIRVNPPKSKPSLQGTEEPKRSSIRGNKKGNEANKMLGTEDERIGSRGGKFVKTSPHDALLEGEKGRLHKAKKSCRQKIIAGEDDASNTSKHNK